MHIHRGFGCAVLNKAHWNDRVGARNSSRNWQFSWEDSSLPLLPQEPVLRNIDDVIADLKAAVPRRNLLSRVPAGLSQIQMTFNNCENKKYKKTARRWLNSLFSEVRKRGPPQPKDQSFVATEVIIGFAGWSAGMGYCNIWGKENPYWVVKSQGDPGKLIYAYTIGSQLDLLQGQILLPIDRIQYLLLVWLEGLDGMTFRLMGDDEFDDKHPKFKKSTRWVTEWNTRSINVVAVRKAV